MATLTMTPSDMLYEPDPSPVQAPTPHLAGTIYVVVLGIIVLIVSTAVFLLYSSYNNHLRLSENAVTSTAAIYQENARLVMSGVDNLLASMVDHLSLTPNASVEELREYLLEMSAEVPTLRVLLVIGADGIVTMDSWDDQAAVGIDVSDRDYFLAHARASSVDDTIHVGEPVQSRVDGAWSMPFSRGVYDEQGNLAAVVVASIEPRYFHDIFTSIQMEAAQRGAMLRDDGVILSVLPYDDTLISQVEPEFQRLSQNWVDHTAQQGAFLGNDDAIIGLNSVAGWPLTLAFVVDRDTALQGFYDDVLRVGMLSILLIVIVIGTGRYQIRQAQALTLQSGMLQRANTKLRREIEERRDAEHSLTWTNRQLNMLMDHLPVLLYTIHRPGEFTPKYVGGSLLETLGYSLDDLRGDAHFWREHIHPDDRVRVIRSLDTTLRSTNSHNQQYRWRCADGRYIWIMDYMRLVKDPSTGTGYLVGFWVDVTQQQRGMEAQRTSEQLRVDLEREQELHKLRSRFLSMITHEFRNPIAALTMSVSNLERYGSRMTDDKRAEKYDILYKVLDQLNLLVEDILLTGKLEADQLDIELERADFAAYCADVVAMFRLTNGAEHDVIYSGRTIYTQTLFDTRLMRHALLNVLGNAAKYSQPGSVINFTLRQVEQGSEVTIQDQGRGIPSAALQRLFDLFYRADNVSGVSGTGVGLALTKHIIDLHHGTITVESTLGVGTTVTIRLPVT